MRRKLAGLMVLLLLLGGCSSSEEQPEPVDRELQASQLHTELQIFRARLVGIDDIIARFMLFRPCTLEDLNNAKAQFRRELEASLEPIEEVDD